MVGKRGRNDKQNTVQKRGALKRDDATVRDTGGALNSKTFKPQIPQITLNNAMT